MTPSRQTDRQPDNCQSETKYNEYITTTIKRYDAKETHDYDYVWSEAPSTTGERTPISIGIRGQGDQN